MKNRTIISLLLVALLLFSMLSGCAKKTDAPAATAVTETAAPEPTAEPEPTAAPEQAGINTIDMLGREIALDAPASRIVALSPADCEILFAIGAGETLVGRGEYCDYPVETADVPSVQSGYETNIEQIIALSPEVLVMTKMGQTQEQVATLENAGIKVVVSDAQDIAGVYVAIALLGTLTGHDAEAAALVGQMQDAFAAIVPAVVAADAKTVYFEVSPLEYGLWTAGSGTFMNEIAQMLGLTNCFADVTGWAEVSEEQVLSRNPDYIVTISMYYGEGPTPEEEILARAGWENVTAIQKQAVLNLQNNELSRPGPRLCDGAALMYEMMQDVAADKAA